MDKIMTNMETVVNSVIITINEHLQDIRKGHIGKIIDTVENIWSGIDLLQTNGEIFLEHAVLLKDVISNDVALFVQSEIDSISSNFSTILSNFNQQTSKLAEEISGLGLKYHGSMILFGLIFPDLDIEFVYSTKKLFHCSRFDLVNNLLKDKEAARVMVRVSHERKLGRFLILAAGVGGGFAFHIDGPEFVGQIQVFAVLLGTKFTADLFVMNSGMALYSEINIWRTFLAQVDITLQFGQSWYDLTLEIEGRFVGKYRRKRQIQTDSKSFDASFKDALINAVNMVSDEVDMRLNHTQNAIDDAQWKLVQAQNWLEAKKQTVMEANKAFDIAIESLENAKEKLEEAKEPYYKALSDLAEAQRKVDKLCKIRSCPGICVPGVRLKECKRNSGWPFFKTITFACFQFTGCLFRLPNIPCIAGNRFCSSLRGIAYLALGVAQAVVKGVIIVYDAAQLAVSFAQLKVDNSRVVLYVAEGVLSLAQVVLEGSKELLKIAKEAFEAVRDAIGNAVSVFEYIVQHSPVGLLDVRNCRFNIRLSTSDIPVFDVYCEVKAFNFGWQIFRFRINFTNIFQSIWQAAKATIRTIIIQFPGLSDGRKRRDLALIPDFKAHPLLRHVMSLEEDVLNSTQSPADTFIDTSSNNDGFRGDSFTDYDNRVGLFQIKCKTIAKVMSFLHATFSSLFDIANKTRSGLDDLLNTKLLLQQYNLTSTANNLTLEEAGVSAEYALSEFNITQDVLDRVLEEANNATMSDTLTAEIDSNIKMFSESIDAEINATESFHILDKWLIVMEKSNYEYFNVSECYRFRDCVYHSISLLYDLYTEENLPEIDKIQSTISTLETYVLVLLQNTSSSVSNTFNASSVIMDSIRYLADSNLFCSRPPVFILQIGNQTAALGSRFEINCNVISDPAPAFWWYKNDEELTGYATGVLAIDNVTYKDAGVYRCTAGNVVANITSLDILLTVVSLDESSEEQTEFPILIVGVVLSIFGTGVIAIVIILLIRSKRPNHLAKVHPEHETICEDLVQNRRFTSGDKLYEANSYTLSLPKA